MESVTVQKQTPSQRALGVSARRQLDHQSSAAVSCAFDAPSAHSLFSSFLFLVAYSALYSSTTSALALYPAAAQSEARGPNRGRRIMTAQVWISKLSNTLLSLFNGI